MMPAFLYYFFRDNTRRFSVGESQSLTTAIKGGTDAANGKYKPMKAHKDDKATRTQVCR